MNQQRVIAPAPAQTESRTVLDTIRQRRAVRDYKPDSVPAPLLQQLMDAASWAPSAMNEQPWHFTVVSDRRLLDELSNHAKTAMLRNVEAVPRPNHFREVLGDPDFHIFYHAPVLIVISAPADGHWSTEDCALAAQNMMLAASSFGLGTCWVGFAQGFLNTLEGRQLLKLRAEDRAVAPIIVGHPRAPVPPVARKALTVNWIGDIKPQPQKDASFEPATPPGDHGGLIHP